VPLHHLRSALVTGMTNFEVAAYLLDRGLEGLDGVVFLDENDRKMVLQRSNKKVLPLTQCGIPVSRRFCFYDQVHTTGTDVQHAVNAQAVLTLGKDLTFRGTYKEPVHPLASSPPLVLPALHF
jgi:hypothetical protein